MTLLPLQAQPRLRLATFNTSLYRESKGQLTNDLSTPDDKQAQNIAEVIQRVRPDILLLNEFDYDGTGRTARLFRRHYLMRGQHGAKPIFYHYFYVAPSNTGVLSGFDLNRDGKVALPDDGLGFGAFPGQYAFVIFSRYPLAAPRTFRHFLWRDLPGALLPIDPATGRMYYTQEALEVLRLSSKNHIDLPVWVGKKIIHLLASHPTPPTFDGPEDRNGRRNHDEIRFWAEYLNGKSFFPVDDRGDGGSLRDDASFVIMGDMNADPYDGDSTAGAAAQILDHPRVHHEVARGRWVPKSEGGRAFALSPRGDKDHRGDPAEDTAAFTGGLRVDYVLPSADMQVVGSGVFWPTPEDPLYRLVEDSADNPSSDHHLVWVDITLP